MSGADPAPKPPRLEEAVKRLPEIARASFRHPAIRRAIGTVRAHYASPELVAYRRVADKVALSPAYFSRLFKRVTGVTYSDFVTRVRIRQALEALAEDPYQSVTGVAFATGFGSLRTLERQFERLVGTTPSRYRAEVRRWLRSTRGVDPP